MGRISRRKIIVGSGLGALALAAGGGLLAVSKPGGALVPGTPRARRIASDSDLPPSSDVVVIGGGFVGTCTAFYLAQRGVSVTLCEKGVIAGESSGRSFGLVDQGEPNTVKFDLMRHSAELWRTMNQQVQGETGFREQPSLILLRSREQLEAMRQAIGSESAAREGGMRVLDAPATARMLNASADAGWAGALYQEKGAVAEPKLAAPAIAEGARRHGARILQQCAVRGIERSAGRVSSVITERGAIRTNTVVLAGGVWSPLFARSLGLKLPQLPSHSTMVSIAPLPQAPAVDGIAGGLLWRRELDGGYYLSIVNGAVPITPSTFRHFFKFLPAMRAFWSYVDPVLDWSRFAWEWNAPATWALDKPSPFESVRIYQPEIRERIVDDALARLRKMAPGFANAKERERWAGALVTTPDNIPVIAPVQAIPGLYLGTGFYYGLTLGPAAGFMLANLITGQASKVDPRPFRYERFIDGSSLTFDP